VAGPAHHPHDDGDPADEPLGRQNDDIEQAVVELRRQARILLEAADALAEVVGAGKQMTETILDPKAAERAADEAHRARQAAAAADSTVDGGEDPDAQSKFAVDFKAKQEEAQAAAFSQPAATSVPDGWVCPDHGAQSVKDDVSPKGRKFRRCTICNKFQH
jgi:hypothetical protein